MDKINELNKELSERILNNLENSKGVLTQLDSKYPEVNLAKQHVLDFDIDNYKKSVEESLKNKLIDEWIKYQAKDEIEFYDMIYFEYHEQSHEYAEALSYGIYDMREYALTIDRHYFGSDYKFSNWEAGLGLMLEPFEAANPISYMAINDDEHFDLLSYEDPDSGFEQIWDSIHAICKYVLNMSFREADKLNLFDQIKIKKGGFFMYDIHDGGSVLDPFYIKG